MTDSVIVVIGASSQIGFFLIPELIASGYTVIGVSRKPLPEYFIELEKHPKLQWSTFNDLENTLVNSSFTLVSVGPLSLTEKLLNKFNPKQVLAISTASIYFKQDSSESEEKALIAGIQESEKSISSWGQKLQTEVIILRPTLVYGCGLDQNLTRVANLIRRWGFLPIAGKAKGLRQPVHAEDIAVLIIALLERDDLPSGIWPLTGASSLSYRQMMSAVFAALDKKPRFLPLAGWLLTFLSKFVSAVHPAMITRQNLDLTLEDNSAQEQLGWSPRVFHLLPSEIQPPTP